MLAKSTERLNIRNFTAEDAIGLHAIILGYNASPYASYDHQWPTELNEIKKVTEWFASASDYLAVCLKDEGALIGLITLNPGSDPNGNAYHLGYIFDFNHHGHGYATEACSALITDTFDNTDAKYLSSGTAKANTPSRNLLERLGFQITSEQKASFHKDEQGQPIEFPALTYTLPKSLWEERG